MRIRVLFIIPTLDRCGAEKQLTLIASNLPKDRFEVSVAVLTRDGPYSQNLCEAEFLLNLLEKGQVFSSATIALKISSGNTSRTLFTLGFCCQCLWSQSRFCLRRSSCRLRGAMCRSLKSAWHGWIDRKLESQTTAYAVNSSGIVDFYVNRGIPKENLFSSPMLLNCLKTTT